MAQRTERQFIEVHQRLHAFELRVLARPSHTIDLTTLQVTVVSLRADMDAILEARVPEFEDLSAEPAEEVIASLFATTAAPSP